MQSPSPKAVGDLKANHLLSVPAAPAWHLHGAARCWWREHPLLERSGGTTAYPVVTERLCLWGTQNWMGFEYLQGWRLRDLSGLGTIQALASLAISFMFEINPHKVTIDMN